MDTRSLEETIRQAMFTHLREQAGALPTKIKIRTSPRKEPNVRIKVGTRPVDGIN